MTLRRSTAALAGFALLAQFGTGCCNTRPLFSRLNYCGPVLNRPLFVANPHAAPVGVAAAPVELGGYPVGVPVGGAPGCAGCGGGAPVGMAPGYPQDAFAHAAPPGHALVGVPPQFTGYPTPVMGQPAPLGGPSVSRELPPPQMMPKQ